MVRVFALLAAAVLCAALVRQPSPVTSWAEGAPDAWARLDLSSLEGAGTGFFCPMDRDVSSQTAGFCPRCGMKLVSGLPGRAAHFSYRGPQDPAAGARFRDRSRKALSRLPGQPGSERVHPHPPGA